jgi:hypothetical protein
MNLSSPQTIRFFRAYALWRSSLLVTFERSDVGTLTTERVMTDDAGAVSLRNPVTASENETSGPPEPAQGALGAFLSAILIAVAIVAGAALLVYAAH